MQTKVMVLLLSFALLEVISFLVGIDFTTYNASELANAGKYLGSVDFTWASTLNSSGVSPHQWIFAFNNTNKIIVYSQDIAMQFIECAAVRNYTGSLIAAMAYYQSQSSPKRQLTIRQIDQYWDVCKAGVILDTKNFSSPQQSGQIMSLIGYDKVYGAVLQMNVLDLEAKGELNFINQVVSRGKVAFIKFEVFSSFEYPSQIQISRLLQFLKKGTLLMNDNRVRIIITRYDKYTPITGIWNSIYSALKAAQDFQ